MCMRGENEKGNLKNPQITLSGWMPLGLRRLSTRSAADHSPARPHAATHELYETRSGAGSRGGGACTPGR